MIEPWSLPGPIKALTVHQPWAWLIMHGGKTIENRTWPTNHRGPLVIHASARRSPLEIESALIWVQRNIEGGDDLVRRVPRAFPVPRLQFGGFVGVVDLVDVRPTASRAALEGKPHVSNPWHIPGYYGWVLANPRPVEFAQWPGQQSLWGRFEVRAGDVYQVRK